MMVVALTSKEAIEKVKADLAQKERSVKMYDAVMEKTYSLTIKNHGSGMDIYLKGEVNKHFRNDRMNARCSIIRNREEILALIDMGYFDVPTSENPILIIKPKKIDESE